MLRRTVFLVIGLVSAGCGEPPPPAPSAVIHASPEAVCIGDEYETTIVLDASDSAPYLTLVYVPPDPDAPPLRFAWSFSGSQKTLLDGNEHGAELSLAMKGDRPLHVTLEVENDIGGVSSATKSIAVTPLDTDGNCPLPPVEE